MNAPTIITRAVARAASKPSLGKGGRLLVYVRFWLMTHWEK